LCAKSRSSNQGGVSPRESFPYMYVVEGKIVPRASRQCKCKSREERGGLAVSHKGFSCISKKKKRKEKKK